MEDDNTTVTQGDEESNEPDDPMDLDYEDLEEDDNDDDAEFDKQHQEAAKKSDKELISMLQSATSSAVDGWSPSPKIICLAVRWAKRTKAHYYNESLNSVRIVAAELVYSVAEFLRLRGWIITEKKNNWVSTTGMSTAFPLKQ